MTMQYVAAHTLVLVLGLLVFAAATGLTGLWPQFWLVLAVNLAAAFPRRS